METDRNKESVPSAKHFQEMTFLASHKVPITAVFPACNRIDASLETLEMIKKCRPQPNEILVHVDGGEPRLRRAIMEAHPDVKILVSDQFLGPGGARNRLVKAASHEWVASFDDDSSPLSTGYFRCAFEAIMRFPDAAVISAASQDWEKLTPGYMRFGVFSGCGCVFSRSWFNSAGGFVPLRIAYCMEEVDLSLRLFHAGALIVHDPRLQVNHRNNPPKSVPVELDAHVLCNIVLMPLLRYPTMLVPLSALHLILRAWRMICAGRWRGLIAGLALLPSYLSRYLRFRKPVSIHSLLAWRELCSHPELLNFHGSASKMVKAAD